MMRQWILLFMLLAIAGLGSVGAQNCSLPITSPLAFGTYTGAQIRSSTPARARTGPSSTKLSYSLYSNSARTPTGATPRAVGSAAAGQARHRL